MSDEEVEGLFQRAGEGSSNTVGVSNLANLLQQHQQQGNLFKIIKRYDHCRFVIKPYQTVRSLPVCVNRYQTVSNGMIIAVLCKTTCLFVQTDMLCR